MTLFDEVQQKFNYSFPADLDKFKKAVEESNSLNQLSSATGISKPYLKHLLKEYDLSTTPKCLYCNRPLPKAQNGTVKKFCNNSCSYLHKLTEKHCEACGKKFSTTKGTKYRSPECKKKAYSTTLKTCEWCGKQYKGHKSSKYCSKDCKTKANISALDKTFSTCKACGKQFIGVYGCSKLCRQQLASERAKKLLIQVYGTYKKDEIKKGMKLNGKKTI